MIEGSAYSASTASNSCEIPERTEDSLKTLDVTTLSPGLKHPTIFDWYEELQLGESFLLINDHDPKPLYYQMLAQLGPVFNWDYKEKGPKTWKVLIGKKQKGEVSIGEIAAKDIRKAEAMRRLGIDFCCGGNKTLTQAATEAGLSVDELKSKMSEVSVDTTPGFSFDTWDCGFLADYIYNQHHKYYYEHREMIANLADKVVKVHGASQPAVIEINRLVKKLFEELDLHFYKEEQILFPYIKRLSAANSQGKVLTDDLDISAGPVNLMQVEHEMAGEILRDIRQAAGNYKVPEGACGSFIQLYRSLSELEADLHQHIHLENNILFKKALELSRKVSG